MEILTRAIETTAKIDAQRNLVLDEPIINIKEGSKVRVIILFPENDDVDEQMWYKAMSSNSAFNFLKEPEENIYTISDGRPFNDKE